MGPLVFNPDWGEGGETHFAYSRARHVMSICGSVTYINQPGAVGVVLAKDVAVAAVRTGHPIDHGRLGRRVRVRPAAAVIVCAAQDGGMRAEIALVVGIPQFWGGGGRGGERREGGKAGPFLGNDGRDRHGDATRGGKEARGEGGDCVCVIL